MTIKTDFLENIAGDKSLAVGKIVDGSAKMWVNYDGISASLRKGVNTSSAVDNGVGDYTFNLTNVFSAHDYYVGGTADSVAGTDISMWSVAMSSTASSIRVNTGFSSTGGFTDAAYVHCAALGDLA